MNQNETLNSNRETYKDMKKARHRTVKYCYDTTSYQRSRNQIRQTIMRNDIETDDKDIRVYWNNLLLGWVYKRLKLSGR